jgi:hypothetical protein
MRPQERGSVFVHPRVARLPRGEALPRRRRLPRALRAPLPHSAQLPHQPGEGLRSQTPASRGADRPPLARQRGLPRPATDLSAAHPRRQQARTEASRARLPRPRYYLLCIFIITLPCACELLPVFCV